MRQVRIVRGCVGLALAVSLLGGPDGVAAQAAPPEEAALAPPTEFPVESFVQTASSGRLEENPDSWYTLVLEEAEPSVAFLETADREIGRVPAELFLSGGESDPPTPPDSARGILRAAGCRTSRSRSRSLRTTRTPAPSPTRPASGSASRSPICRPGWRARR